MQECNFELIVANDCSPDNTDVIIQKIMKTHQRANKIKYSWDTSLSLYNRVLTLEIDLIRKNIKNIILNSYETIMPDGKGNLYLKKDFNDICELKLDELKTVGETIDRLRALSHGDYKNAFFIDSETGKKIFISVQLTEEL